jgi:hypothetical protein
MKRFRRRPVDRFTITEPPAPDGRQLTVTLHEVAVDGLPDMKTPDMPGRVAFIFDGAIATGWPVGAQPHPEMGHLWQAANDIGDPSKRFGNVTHWLEFPEPLWHLASGAHHTPRLAYSVDEPGSEYDESLIQMLHELIRMRPPRGHELRHDWDEAIARLRPLATAAEQRIAKGD